MPRCFRARDREVTSTAVAPTGFRTLSTHCSPPDLPGLFHPGPASGVHPSRLCSAVSAVRTSRPARTLLRFLTHCRVPFPANGLAWLRAPPLQGFAHPPQPASVVWVLHHTPLLLPPWACPSEVCSGLVRRAECPVPLSRFADLSPVSELMGRWVTGAPGFLLNGAVGCDLSRGPPRPPWGFLPLDRSGLLGLRRSSRNDRVW